MDTFPYLDLLPELRQLVLEWLPRRHGLALLRACRTTYTDDSSYYQLLPAFSWVYDQIRTLLPLLPDDEARRQQHNNFRRWILATVNPWIWENPAMITACEWAVYERCGRIWIEWTWWREHPSIKHKGVQHDLTDNCHHTCPEADDTTDVIAFASAPRSFPLEMMRDCHYMCM